MSDEFQTFETRQPISPSVPVRNTSACLFPMPGDVAAHSPLKVVSLDESRVRIGRLEEPVENVGDTVKGLGKLVLSEGDGGVEVRGDVSMSRDHARIERQGRRWIVIDEGSTNGTFVDDVRVTSCILSNGDVLQFGKSVRFLFGLTHEVVSWPQ